MLFGDVCENTCVIGVITVINVAWWCNGYDIGFATRRVTIRLPAIPLSANDLKEVVHTHATVTKPYKLVPVKGQ